MTLKKPNSDKLWNVFPSHITYHTLADLYSSIDNKKIKAAVGWLGSYGNTCASRMSIAFNNAGAPIDADSAHDVCHVNELA